MFALFKVKTWSNSLVVFVFFCFRRSRSPCRKKRIFEKQAPQKTQFLKLKSGPIMLRNITGPLFNFNLDQFIRFHFFCCFFGWNPYFYSVFSKMQNWKKHSKETKTLFVNTTVLTAFVKMSFFSAFFHLCCFTNFQFFRDVFDRFPKIKRKQQNSKARRSKKKQPENKIQSKKKWNVMIQNNTRQQAEKQ